MKTLGTRLSTSRPFLLAIYYPWIALPYPLRKVATVAGIWLLQLMRRVRRVHRRQSPTPPERMFTLSFWWVPRVSESDYALTVDGSVQSDLRLGLQELKSLAAVERPVTLDCVGGSRNNCVMRGVSFQKLLDRAGPDEEVQTAVFYCADGFITTHPVQDLVSTEAFMAYSVNGQDLSDHGYPLRLVAPGKYGYKWAKWVERIELVPGSPKGYWEKRGLPDRAWVGDLR